MKLIIIIFSILTATAVNAMAAEKVIRIQPSKGSILNGEKLFYDLGCVMCHGELGNGEGIMAEGLSPKPRNFKSLDEMKRLSDAQIYMAIKHGIVETAMPSFNDLSDEQIRSLTEYIRSFLLNAYATVNTCLNVKQTLEHPFGGKVTAVENENPELILVKSEGNLITIKPKIVKAILTMKSKKSLRTHLILKDANQKILSLVAIRIHKCFKED